MQEIPPPICFPMFPGIPSTCNTTKMIVVRLDEVRSISDTSMTCRNTHS